MVAVPRLLFVLLAVACWRVEDGGVRAGKPPDARAEGPSVVVGSERVRVMLARTEDERRQGLMFVKSLPMDAGMLFFMGDDEVQSFWMQNTYIPLDMIFIDRDLRVACMVENAEPLTTTGRSCGVPSRYVLEVNGGWAAAHGVGTGTQVKFENMP